MSLDGIKGQDLVIGLLKRSISNDCLSHAYLFSGPSGVGKKKTALAFAQSLNCLDPNNLGDSCNNCISCKKALNGNQPDLHLIEPDGHWIKISQIRALKNNAAYSSYESKYKIIIFEDAHLMTAEGANSLLKILEEPPVNTLFILVTSEPQQLLETIHSRCQQIHFKHLSNDLIKEILVEKYGENVQAQIISRLARGSISKAFTMVSQEEVLKNRLDIIDFLKDISDISIEQIMAWAEKWDKDREGVATLLEVAQIWYRDQLIWKVTGEDALIINEDYLKKIKEGRYTLDKINNILEILHKSYATLKYNVNPRLVLEVLLLKIKFNS